MSLQEFHDKKDLKNIIAESQAIQAEAAVQNAKDVNKINYQLKKYSWLVVVVLLFLGINSIRMHYSWSGDLDNAHNSFMQSNARNRDLALQYHNHRQQTEDGLRDKIDELHIEIEKLERAKKGMRERVVASADTINKLVFEKAKDRASYLLARETNLICLGITKDDPSMLRRAEDYQTQRTGKPFSIKEWKNLSTLAEVLFKLDARNCAKWIVQQDSWKEAIDENLCVYLLELANK